MLQILRSPKDTDKFVIHLMENINEFFNITGFNGKSRLITREELWKHYLRKILLN